MLRLFLALARPVEVDKLVEGVAGRAGPVAVPVDRLAKHEPTGGAPRKQWAEQQVWDVLGRRFGSRDRATSKRDDPLGQLLQELAQLVHLAVLLKRSPHLVPGHGGV